MDDTDGLLQRWQEGDRDSLMVLVDREAPWIQATIRRRRGDALRVHVETEDQFQDLMLQVLRYAPRFRVRSREQFRALLARMIENDLIDRSRRRQRRGGTLAQHDFSATRLDLDPPAPTRDAPPQRAAEQEDLAWMRLGLEFLPSDDRLLVQQHTFASRTFVELVDDWAVDGPATLRQRYHRAVVRLAVIVDRLQRGDLEGLLTETDD